MFTHIVQSNKLVAPGSEICPPGQMPVQTPLPMVDFHFPSSHGKQVTPFESVALVCVALGYIVYPARHTQSNIEPLPLIDPVRGGQLKQTSDPPKLYVFSGHSYFPLL